MLTGKEFISNLLNRLRVVRSEDIGPANPPCVAVARRRINEYLSLSNLLMRNEDRIKKLMGVIKLYSKSLKSRATDNVIHRFMEPAVGDKKIEFDTWMGKKLFRGSRGDCKELIEYMNNFIAALNEKNDGVACYWFQKIYDIDPSKRYGAPRPTTRRPNKDCVYAVWEELVKRSQINYRDTPHTKIVRALLADFDEPGRKNGRTERLYMVNAIIIECRKRELKNIWWTPERCWQESKITDEEWKIIQRHELIPLNELVVDKHTEMGKQAGKDSEYFWKVGGYLENVPELLRNDPNAEYAMKLNMQRDKKKIRAPERKKKTVKKKKKKKKKRVKKRKRVIGENEDDEDYNDKCIFKKKRRKVV
jgi:hypothetical protein